VYVRDHHWFTDAPNAFLELSSVAIARSSVSGSSSLDQFSPDAGP